MRPKHLLIFLFAVWIYMPTSVSAICKIEHNKAAIAHNNLHTIHHPFPIIKIPDGKDVYKALGLAILGGFAGAHNYYLEKYPQAAIQSLLFVFCIGTYYNATRLKNSNNVINDFVIVVSTLISFFLALALIVWVGIDILLML